MNVWNKHWFGPVAAIRLYLFQKFFLLILAMDLVVLMVERGGRYGLDVMPFNIPHFSWLQPAHQLLLPLGIPHAVFYVALTIITSFFTFLLVLGGHRPWLMAFVTLLYTYCWAMSRLDSYLHHYMISLIMACMVFFPPIDGRLLYQSLMEHASPRLRGPASPRSWTALTLFFVVLAIAYRLLLSQGVGLNVGQRWAAMFACCAVFGAFVVRRSHRLDLTTGPRVSSWAFRLLGTTVGVIYVFTSMAKMDAEWCGGHTLRQVGATAQVLNPIERLAATMGIAPELFWAGMATCVIPLELTLAVGYLFAVRQDEPDRLWLRRLCLFVWCLAIGLHLNNEMMNLVIQWFGYYMLLLATLILLPARYLMVMGCVFYCPEAVVRNRFDAWVKDLSSGQATVVLGIIAMFALFVVVLSGFFIWILGARIASCLLAAAFVIVLLVGMVLGWERRSIGISICVAAAGMLLIAATAQSSMRFDYFDLRGKTLQQMGQHDPAIMEMNEALIFSPPSPQAAAELYTNLGLSYRRTSRFPEAEDSYRKAIQLSDRAFLAHYGLANMLVEAERYDEAETAYQQAIQIKFDFSDAYVNLGNLLDFLGRHDEAVKRYRTALAIEPGALDIQRLLAAAEVKSAQSSKP